MAKLYIAANLVTKTAPLINAGHLQIVYKNDMNQYYEIEVQIPDADYGMAGGDWNFVGSNGQAFHGRDGDDTDHVKLDGTPTNTARYARTELTLRDGQTAEDVWTMLLGIHNSIVTNGSNLDYDTYLSMQNSNSYVTSMLYAIGQDIADYIGRLSTATDIKRYPGIQTNVLKHGDNGAFGDYNDGVSITIEGTPGNDFLRGGNNDDAINGNGGDDIILGNDGKDLFEGGAGRNILSGGEGDDTFRLHSESGTGDDFSVIWGGAGADTYHLTADHDGYSREWSNIVAIHAGEISDELLSNLDIAAFETALEGELGTQIDYVVINPGSDDVFLDLYGNALQWSLEETVEEYPDKFGRDFFDTGDTHNGLPIFEPTEWVDVDDTVTYSYLKVNGNDGGVFTHNSWTGTGNGFVTPGSFYNDLSVSPNQSGGGSPIVGYSLIGFTEGLAGLSFSSYENVNSYVTETRTVVRAIDSLGTNFTLDHRFGPNGEGYYKVPVDEPEILGTTLSDETESDSSDPLISPEYDTAAKLRMDLNAYQLPQDGTPGGGTPGGGAPGPGNDYQKGSADPDTFYLGDGHDVAFGYAGADSLFGDAGNDMLFGGDGDDQLSGGDGDDTLLGEAGADSLTGGNGDDLIYIDDDDTSWSGDAGIDTLIHTGSVAKQYALAQGGFEHGRFGSGNDTIQGTGDANEIHGGLGDDTINGDGGNDVLVGGAGNDSLNGGDGLDTLDGGFGDDLLDGGSGEDIASYDGIATDYAFTLNIDGSTTVQNAAYGTDTLLGIERVSFSGDGSIYDLTELNSSGPNVITGTSGDDYLAGTSSDDEISGLAGDDHLDGLAGNDTLLGGDGNDTLNGGAGDDVLAGGGGTYNQVDYEGVRTDFSFIRNVDDSVTVTSTAWGTDTLTDINGVWFVGEAKWYDIDDLIDYNSFDTIDTGTTGDDYLVGTAGNDAILGGEGTDTLYGGLGDDLLDGQGGGYNQADYDGAASDYTFTRNADDSITVSHATYGTDTLKNIDGVWFYGESAWYDIDTLAPDPNTYVGTGHSGYFGGTTGDDTIIFTGGTGNYVNADDGNDIIVFSGNVADYNILGQGDHFTIEDTAGNQNIQFTEVEYIRFGDTGPVSLADIVANSTYNPGDTWFDPEPVGGLI
ncbi:calcium-binding protein [uncultured Hoeflea sp.]|uniref:calcium-binding protein n=1 Tax=uncultured Hoeflea sp. TaxID=538666 RepID=UPI00260F6EC7|nr:calcium-binding protein [uncultured Hoeflea sp.]